MQTAVWTFAENDIVRGIETDIERMQLEIVATTQNDGKKRFEVKGHLNKLTTQVLAYESTSRKEGSNRDRGKPSIPQTNRYAAQQSRRRGGSQDSPRRRGGSQDSVLCCLDPEGWTSIRDKRLNWCSLFVGEDWPSISIPSSFRGDFVIHQHESRITVKGLKHDTLHWVFTSSYHRYISSPQPTALLDREKAWGDNGGKLVRQVLVVRSEEFEAYREDFGCTYVVLGLPTRFRLKEFLSCTDSKQFDSQRDSDNDEVLVTSTWGGVGFSRLFTQIFAYIMGLESIWMMDDNVWMCWKMDLDSDPLRPQPCSFLDVIEGISSLVRSNVDDETKDPLMGKPLPDEVACPKNGRQTPRCQTINHGAQTVENRADFSGSCQEYAVIGMSRDVRRFKAMVHPFRVTHSVYSFFWLNVKSTVERGVLYPPKTYWEDIVFNQLCEEKRMAVLKHGRFFHAKRNLQRRNFARKKHANIAVCVNDGEEESLQVPACDVECRKCLEHLGQRFKDCYILQAAGELDGKKEPIKVGRDGKLSPDAETEKNEYTKYFLNVLYRFDEKERLQSGQNMINEDDWSSLHVPIWGPYFSRGGGGEKVVLQPGLDDEAPVLKIFQRVFEHRTIPDFSTTDLDEAFNTGFINVVFFYDNEQNSGYSNVLKDKFEKWRRKHNQRDGPQTTVCLNLILPAKYSLYFLHQEPFGGSMTGSRVEKQGSFCSSGRSVESQAVPADSLVLIRMDFVFARESEGKRRIEPQADSVGGNAGGFEQIKDEASSEGALRDDRPKKRKDLTDTDGSVVSSQKKKQRLSGATGTTSGSEPSISSSSETKSREIHGSGSETAGVVATSSRGGNLQGPPPAQLGGQGGSPGPSIQPTNVEEETSESASSAARGSEQGGLHGSATTQGAQSAIFTLRGGGTEDDPHMCDSLAEES